MNDRTRGAGAGSGLGLAKARLLHAACAYVDAEQEDDELNDGTLYGELESARDAYRTALRAQPRAGLRPHRRV